MTIEDIKTALKTALKAGSGNLDDLDALLERAKEDIEALKQEEKRKEAERKAKEDAARKQEEERKKKRGNEIAAMANRVLEDKATDADVAMVLTAYLRGRGITEITVDPSVVDVAFSITEEDWANIEKLIEKIANMDIITSNILGNKPSESSVSAAKTAKDIKAETSTSKEPTSTDFDDAVDRFLKDLGIR